MNKVIFLLGIHCHQPVGNFEGVFEEAYRKAYLPFIEVVEKHPRIKLTVHYSGILYQWFLDRHPDFMGRLKKLIGRGQLEVMTGGFFEPIIPIIPDADKIGQIKKETDYIKQNLGYAPRGMWLTERIWEPHIVKPLVEAGVEYLTVDDFHFISAGLSEPDLFGYYLTEEDGETLALFPISKKLRYLIPFKLPGETIEYLRSIAAEGDNTAAILADDGEKFGSWPGTNRWVYEEKWLEKFFEALEENREWIETRTFSEYLDTGPPRGRIYLPTASYAEMMEWSLPADAGRKLDEMKEKMIKRGEWEEASRFFKGGFFRNFFVKYPEANNMHKKMLRVSHKVNSLPPSPQRDAAREELWQGQCNCAYWHGVFGGLYLPHLRDAVYQHLIAAEIAADQWLHPDNRWLDLAVTDFDKDGADEILLANRVFNLYLAPAYGGSIFEIDFRPAQFNMVNTLARREEVYHQKIKERQYQKPEEGEGTPSIHNLVRVKEEGLEKLLNYDWHRRLCLLDHILEPGSTRDDFASGRARERGDFVNQPYAFYARKTDHGAVVTLSRNGGVFDQNKKLPLKITKRLFLGVPAEPARGSFRVEHEVVNTGQEKINLRLGIEFNINLLGGNAPDRYFEIPGQVVEVNRMGSGGEFTMVETLHLVDKWKGFRVIFKFDSRPSLWLFPVETVSQSEEGYERVYQGSVIFPYWDFYLKAGEIWKENFEITVESIGTVSNVETGD